MKPGIGLIVSLALSASPALAQSQTATPAANANLPGRDAAPASSYVIGADDTLHIDVWKEPDLTATLPVRSDGMISLPLLNDVQAAGLTPMQLAASLSEKL